MTTPNSGSSSKSSDSGSSTSGGSPVELGDTSTADAIVSSAKNTRDDFDLGSDRAIISWPNWASQSSHELYAGAVNNNDPGMVDELGAAWTNQGLDLVAAADTLYEAITELSGAWVGQASGAAQGSLIGVANASSTAGDAARAMGKRMHDQAVAASEVKKMPPPKDAFDPERALAASLAGGPAALAQDMKAQHDEYQALVQEQQRYMDAYTKSMSEVDSSTPSFGPESIGLKPMTGTQYGTGGTGAGVGPMEIAAASPGVSSIGHSVGGLAGGVKVGLGTLGGGMAGTGVGDLGQVSSTALNQPLTATGVGHVTEASTGGAQAAAALGTAALGAGLGFAGAKALGRDSQRDNKQQDEPEVVDEATDATDETDAEGIGELPEVPEARQPGAVASAPSGQSVQMPDLEAPSFGQPVTEWSSPQSAPITMPVTPEFSGQMPPQSPMSAGPAPLAEGATSGAADPAAAAPANQGATASVSAGAEHQGPAAGGQQAQAQQHLMQQQAAAGMAPQPMQPMGGSGAGAGAGAAAGGVGGMAAEDHQAASYLIQPDPDDVFGPTEAVTSGVIGEDIEDD